MWEFAKNPEIRSIISCCGFPMANGTAWKEFVTTNPHITLVNGDSNPYQLNLINQGYSWGLVGQIPFQMGQKSIEILNDAVKVVAPSKEVFGTSLITITRVPVDLPPLQVDQNQIGYLGVLGYILFAIVASVESTVIWLCHLAAKVIFSNLDYINIMPP
jgi:hypothetical protein